MSEEPRGSYDFLPHLGDNEHLCLGVRGTCDMGAVMAPPAAPLPGNEVEGGLGVLGSGLTAPQLSVEPPPERQ